MLAQSVVVMQGITFSESIRLQGHSLLPSHSHNICTTPFFSLAAPLIFASITKSSSIRQLIYPISLSLADHGEVVRFGYFRPSAALS
jgi:hypothetical protein